MLWRKRPSKRDLWPVRTVCRSVRYFNTTTSALEGTDYQTLSRSRDFAVTIAAAYAALGLDPSSTTPDEGRSRFRELIRLNHPDGKPSHEQARANETTRVIVEACTLLRREGFPRVRKRMADARGARYEQQAAPETESADPLDWIDQAWRECVPGNLACVVSPAFGMWFALGAWRMSWEMILLAESKKS